MVKPTAWWCPTARMPWGTVFLTSHKIESSEEARYCETPHTPLYTATDIRKAWEEFAGWCEEQAKPHRPYGYDDRASQGFDEAQDKAHRMAEEW